MKELYDEYFHIPKDGKIRDKVMLVRVATTVVIMLVCLAAISFSAYAYFSCEVASSANMIRAARFEADVSIIGPNNAAVEVTAVDDKTNTAVLQAGTTYRVTLAYPADDNGAAKEDVAKTGFCVMTAEGCPDTYYTQQLGKDATVANGFTGKITFDLRVTANTTVTFLSHWGTSSCYDTDANTSGGNKLYITNANTGNSGVVMVVNGVVDSIRESEGEQNTPPAETTMPGPISTDGVYTVRSGDTLTGISERYGTTIDRIVAYNGFSNADSIQVGQQLQIPPASWEMPENTTWQTTTTQSETSTDPAETEPAAPTETTGTPQTTEQNQEETDGATTQTAGTSDAE